MTELDLPGGVKAVVHVRGADTGGRFTLLTDIVPPGWRLPAHRHDVAETIHVTRGHLAMRAADRAMELGPGETVHVPPDVVHEGATLGPDPAHRILVFSPAGMEELFERLSGTADAREQLRLALAAGWRFGASTT